MRRHVCRASARLAALALAATAALGSFVAVAAPAGAATMVRECKATNVSCISFSGYAGKSIWGYPVSASGNNCVNYVAYRLARNGVPQQSSMGNGGSWATSAAKRGYRVDKVATVGSIAQWNYGSSYAPSNGHVGYVEEVTSAYIVISDSSYGGGYSSRWRVPRGDANWPSNFIHFKDQPYLPPPSGSFLKVRETSALFRLVGKTPTRVVSTTGLGTVTPYLVSSTALATLPAVVADGLFVQGSVRGDIYRVTGGAPLYVASWTSVGGAKPYVRIDQRAIDAAGSGGDYNRLRKVPVDGQALRVLATGKTYIVQGGAALLITSWDQVGGYRSPAPVEPLSLRYAGTPPQYIHLTRTGTLAPVATAPPKTTGLTGRQVVVRPRVIPPQG
jgi:surface antigen